MKTPPSENAWVLACYIASAAVRDGAKNFGSQLSIRLLARSIDRVAQRNCPTCSPRPQSALEPLAESSPQ